LDSCILIDCQEDNETLSKLNHLNGMGHEIMAPLTVIGETVHVCFDKGLDVHMLMTNLQHLELTIIFPAPELREWCRLVDEVNDVESNYGSSVTDRTHLAYAITHGADYFVTHRSEVRNLRVPTNDAVRTKVIDMEKVRSLLKKR
jgi:hypothetical protein